MTWTARFGLVMLAALVGSTPARAGARSLPVPAQVIYPGDRISESMLKDSSEAEIAEAGGVIDNRAELVGKVARRTLLPGRAIAPGAVEEPRAITTGALVQLVYQNDGLSIVTTAQALQNGYVGQAVQVRNIESGTVVSGAVQADGSVRANGG